MFIVPLELLNIQIIKAGTETAEPLTWENLHPIEVTIHSWWLIFQIQDKG